METGWFTFYFKIIESNRFRVCNVCGLPALTVVTTVTTLVSFCCMLMLTGFFYEAGLESNVHLSAWSSLLYSMLIFALRKTYCRERQLHVECS